MSANAIVLHFPSSGHPSKFTPKSGHVMLIEIAKPLQELATTTLEVSMLNIHFYGSKCRKSLKKQGLFGKVARFMFAKLPMNKLQDLWPV